MAAVVASAGDVRNVDHRRAFIHDKIAEAVDTICYAERERPPFDRRQIDCLIEIGVQLVFIADPRNKPARGVLGRAMPGWRDARWIEKAGLAVAFTVGVPSPIIGFVTIWTWVAPLLLNLAR